MRNLSGHNTILNCMAINQDNVLATGGDNGSLHLWDWKTGYCFQQQETIAQPGSLDSELGLFSACFDRSGSRLITGEADKTIKIWKEDREAVSGQPLCINGGDLCVVSDPAITPRELQASQRVQTLLSFFVTRLCIVGL